MAASKFDEARERYAAVLAGPPAAIPNVAEARFNLGSALSFVQVLPHGVYLAMNGKCFPWDRVRKNRERGEFEEIASS